MLKIGAISFALILGTAYMSKLKYWGLNVIDTFRSDNSKTVPDVAKAKSGIYEFTAKTLDGTDIKLKKYKGKKIIILNVASECGYTPQYADWQKFYEENSDKAVVLGFPANNFKGQEPGSNEQIASFCKKNYGVTFPVFEKVSVQGDDKAPIYKWLTTKELNGWNTQEPTWNFCKYLIDEKGKLINFFPSKIKPTSPEFLAAFNK
jgi:glutathione peroxidase